MKTKYLMQTLVILSVSLTTSIVFATGMHLSTNPNAKPYVFHLSSNPKEDLMPLSKHKNVNSNYAVYHKGLSGSSDETPVVTGSPTASVPQGPGTCVSFIESKPGVYNRLYNRCFWMPKIRGADGSVYWVYYRWVQVNCPGKGRYSYIIAWNHAQDLPKGIDQTNCRIISDLPSDPPTHSK